MRKILLLSGIAVVVLLAAVAVYLARIDVNRFRPQLQAAIQKQLGRPVSLGTMDLHFIPLSIRISDVVIAEDARFNTGLPFARAEQVSVAVSLLPLLRKQLHIESFILRQPAIELVRDRAGKWNFATIGGGQGGSADGGGASIAELRVENGSVAMSDLGKKRSVYEHIDISLTGFEPGRPFKLNLAAAMPGANKGSLRLEATAGPMDAPQPPLAGRIEVRQVALAGLRQFLGAGATQADGIVDGNIDFALQNPVLNVQPHLDLKKIRLNGKDAGQDVRIEGELRHDLESGVLRASALRLAAGNVPLVLSGQVDTRKSWIDMTARTSDAPVAGLLAIAAAMGDTGIGGSGRLTLDARVRGPLDRTSELEYFGQGTFRDGVLNVRSLAQPVQVRSANLKLAAKTAVLDGIACSAAGSTLRGRIEVRDFVSPAAAFDLEIDRLDVAEWQRMTSGGTTAKGKSTGSTGTFKAAGKLSVGTLSYTDLVLKQVRSECSLADGVLKLAPLTAQVFGGAQAGGITLDFRSEPATFAMDTKLEAVDANQLLSATTSLKRALYGLLAASGNASMKLLPGAESVRSLNGDLAIRLTKGRLGGINLMNEIASLGKFVGFAGNAQPFTDVVSLTGDVQVRNGIARSDNLLVQVEGGSVAAAGTVNLADESLNLRVTAILGPEATQKAGGSKVGGYLTTALVNGKGELVLPALVTGTFAKPRFAPDAARVAEMKLKSVLPSTGGTGGVAAGVVGLVKGEKGAGKAILESITGTQPEAGKQPAASPSEPPARRKGLLDALQGLQKRTQQPAPAQPETKK